MLLQHVVAEHEGGHGLHHGHRAGHDAGVVAAARAQLRLHLLARHRHLLACDGGRGLERDLHHHRLAVRDAALDAAGAVGAGANVARVVHEELVVVLAPRHERALEAAAHGEPLGRRDGHHRARQVRLQLRKHRRAQPLGDVAHHAGDNAAAAVPLDADLINGINHLLRRLLVRAPHNVALHLLQCETVQVHRLRLHIPNRRHKGENLHSCHSFEDLLRHRSSGHTADGLAS
mmetsp:Transcript_28244/g.61897  ORF Transcript_28244/g.61897 Transcript_28244/m.61897 type:complete len:232 (+) Transcript_28244:617-1312(+)